MKLSIKYKKILLLVLVATVMVIVLSGWYYFGWYMSERQILARCFNLVTSKANECYNNHWVKEAGSEWGRKYHINNCFQSYYSQCLLKNGLMRLPQLDF